MDKQRDFEKGWEEYKAKRKQEIEEMYQEFLNYKFENSCPETFSCKGMCEHFHKAGYRKIPKGAVVMTDKELNEELDAIKCVMIVHDDDGERYVSYDKYKEFTDRLGKIARQRKVRIEQLEKILDDRCDRCIGRERKETAEKFAERLKEEAWAFNTDENGNVWDYSIMKSTIDEICKEITEGKV